MHAPKQSLSPIISAAVVGAPDSLRRCLTAAALLFAGLTVGVGCASQVAAAEPVGQSVKIRNQVSASIGNRRLVRADPVFASERISAAARSHGEILLNDSSKVLVGENSVISLDDFVTGAGGFASGTIRVTKGAFRFITGNSAKGSLKVETPLSAIGIRGTVFDVYVGPGGLTRVLLFRGAVEVCSRGNNCLTLDRPCDVVEVAAPGNVRQLPYLRSPLGDRFAEARDYNLTARQGRFNARWRAPVRACISRALLDSVPRAPVQEPGGGNDRGGVDPGGRSDSGSDNDSGGRSGGGNTGSTGGTGGKP